MWKVIAAAWLIAAPLLPLLRDPQNPGDLRIRMTIDIALSFWFAAVLLMLGLDRNAWRQGGSAGSVRWLWTLGWITYVVHVLVAFHYAFGWSHAAAIAHTQQRSGFGDGIYISHLFTLVWGVDVCWWWLAPATYANRSIWWGVPLHAFLGFMIFNGTVIYEKGMIRWIGVAAFVVLGVRCAAGLRSVRFQRLPWPP